ncbi:MAG: hypothetical protein U0Q18_26700 [Bryobacteraceae bacterium]
MLALATFRCLWISVGLWGGLFAPAEILDRIAVSVGNKVITQMDLLKEIRITAFLNGEKPDFGPENKRRTADRMIDQRLVRSELEVSRYLLPGPADTDAAFEELRKRFPTETAYQAALKENEISEDDLKDMLTWQLTLVRFIDVRFRPGIQIAEEEIRNYFNEHLRPILQKANPGKSISLDDYRDTVEQTLIGEAANAQVEQWLQQARRRTHIQFHDEAFQ